MATFNVAAAIVDIIEAPDEDTAKDILRDRIAAAGLDLYEGSIDSPTGIDAFESEGTEGTVTLTLRIDNYYEGGDKVITTPTVTVPAPPPESDEDEYEDWADEHIMAATGTGRTEGDSSYFVKITESTDPTLVGREFEWGV